MSTGNQEYHQLPRVLGLMAIIAFGLTNEIASGLFFLTTQVQITNPGTGNLVPLLMIVGGLVIILSVIIYRYFFGAGLFGAGGEYVMVANSINRPVAFWVTFISWFGATAVMGTLAYVAPIFLANAATALGMRATASFLTSTTGIIIVGIVFIWGFWAIHVSGIKVAGLLASISMYLIFATVIVLIIIGFSTTSTGLGAALAAKAHVTLAQAIMHSPVQATKPLVAFEGALPVLFFGYLGLSTATQTGAEAKNAKKDLPHAVLITVLTVTVVYTLFSFAVYHAVPWQAISGLNAMGLKGYTTSSGILGLMLPGWANAAISVAIAVILVKTFIPVFLAQSRWLYAWAEEGLIPKAYARTTKTRGTPALALTIGAVLSSISLIESIKMGVSFGASERVLAAMLVFVCLGIGVLLFPRRAPELYRQNTSWLGHHRGLQITVGTLMILISLAFCYSIVVTSLKAPLLLQPAVQALIVSVISVLIYYGFKKQAKPSLTEKQTI